MTETKGKSHLFDEIACKKEFLKAKQKGDKKFNVKFPKTSFDKICQLYGNERLSPISFITYHTVEIKTSLSRLKTVSKELDDNETIKVIKTLDNYYVVPKRLREYDEEKQYELSVKIKYKHVKDIIKKAGLGIDELLDIVDFQVVTLENEETTTKIQISYIVYETIFKSIPLLKVIFENDNFEIAFYSFRTILNKSGIKLEEVIPYLKIIIADINREELMKTIMPLYESVKIRQTKELINQDIRNAQLYILKGCNTCTRYPNNNLDDFEFARNEVSVLLHDIIDKIENKKNNLKNIYDNINNQIIEINDNNDKVKYVRKKIYDAVISSPESKFDEYKINDINNDETIVSKKVLIENKNNNLPLIKLYNKNNSKDDYVYIPIKNIDDILKKFTYIRQEEIFKGKNKNEESIEIKYLLMDVECDTLPGIDESKALYTIPGESAIYESTKKDLLNKLNDDELLICKIKNVFISYDTINNIKKRDLNIKNKKIKYKIKNIINEEEIVIIEYTEIFDNDIPYDFVMLNNKDNPSDIIIVNKNDLVNEMNSWEDPKNDIKIKNQIDNNEISINPSKIIIKTPKKEELPENYENIQDEIIEKIKIENIIIKTNKYYIKKTVVKKIIEDTEEYDIYYVKDIYNKKVKISKKQLIKDNDDDTCQYISISSEEEPIKKIIVKNKKLISKLEEDPTEENITLDEDDTEDGKKYIIKKTKILINPIEIDEEEINFEEQPQKIIKNLIKEIIDYYYIYIDEDNKPHYIRVDTLKLIKDYKSQYPIENFVIDDERGNKVKISKVKANELLENKTEPKYISLEDEENKGVPIFADLTILEKSENDIDEPIQVNNEGKKIKLKNVKISKIEKIKSLPEQPEEKQFQILENLIQNLQKKEPLSDIIQVKDVKNNDIFIFEDTLNKIEENKGDPEKTTYKGNTPMKEEIICGKKINKVSQNIYIKLVEPNIIVNKKDLEKELKTYKPNQNKIIIKDVTGKQSEFEPLNVHIYKSTPEETDVTKILPKDFSDINEKLLIDTIPHNILILSKDLNNKDIIIKKREGDNLIKYPRTEFDEFIIFDKDGKKIKVSRKIIERDNNNIKNEFIEIKDNTNNENHIIEVNEFKEALKDKENEEFEVKNKEGKKIKLNKKKIIIIKQNTNYIDIPEQGIALKNKLLSEIKDCFIKVKDSKNNNETYLRNSQLIKIINHKQKAPFINYEIISPKNEKVYVTKEICQEKINNSPNDKYILCYDETKKDETFLVPLSNIQNAKCDGDEQFECGNGKKIIFKNLRITKLGNAPEIGLQPEEEKMIKVFNLINKIKSGPLNKNYKTKNHEGKPCFISNNYINILQNESNVADNNTQYKINDAFGTNKVILNKDTIDKDKIPGEYVIIKNKNDNNNYLIDLKDLINNLSSFKSTDNEINIINAVDNTQLKINPLNIDIVPPFNDYPYEIIKNEIKEEDKKSGIKLRSLPVRPIIPEKRVYRIRRAIIYKRKKSEDM